jgi:serine protease Do
MKTRNLFFSILFASVLSGTLTLTGYKYLIEKPEIKSFEANQNAVFANYLAQDTANVIVPEGLNFVYAASVVRPTVVHIRTTYNPQEREMGNPHFQDPFFRYFFDAPNEGLKDNRPRQGSGSGVIISTDGYIVTNNHVIENANKIEVVLDDKRKYVAKLIGRDPETDLALLKIEEKGLVFAKYGNSDKIKVGEWVLACGNPFDLTSTITAGIVSAKGRNINLLRNGQNNYAIESFIQTDAAVNPGNSGGALVNLKGELIGINTAIASTTGAYAGYSFAVPVTIVKKIMDDLLNFGEAQRALLGVMIQDVTDELVKEKKLASVKGVYISGVNDNSAAKDAGIVEGDVILKINETEVNSASEVQETISQFRPGDKVNVVLVRNGSKKNIGVVLKNKRGNTSIVKETKAEIANELGAELIEVSAEEKSKLRIPSGIKVSKLMNGKLKASGIQASFIITKIDKSPVKSVQEVVQTLKERTGGVLIEGVYPDGTRAYYAIGW